MARYGEAIDDRGDFRLTIGQRRFRTASIELPLISTLRYTLYADERPVATLWGEVAGHFPSVGLLDLDGRAAWEFDDGTVAAVIFDGRDLREQYGLDRVWRPHIVHGKLIFVGEKDHRSFIVYDGHRVGPDFDRVYVFHCCEAAITASVREGVDSYGFLADREGRSFAVVIAGASDGTVTPDGP